MKRIYSILTLLLLCAFALNAQTAQKIVPKAKAKKEATKEENRNTALSIRAQTQYTAQMEVPADLIWKREVYRTLDLTTEENAGLTYPQTPTDTEMNLFTLIFRLLADRKLMAYEYTLDGSDQLTASRRADFKDILDKYHIYYRRKRIAATNDTVFVIENADIPSNEVLSYYIKEVYYYDQKSSTFSTSVTALCPVLHRSGEFDLNAVKYPMFWIKVSDLSPYMNKLSIPTSPYNNAATVNLDDFFSMRMYKGEIYKTTSPNGKALAQYCVTDSAMKKERTTIEGQLSSIEDNLWKSQMLKAEKIDSTTLVNTKTEKLDTKVKAIVKEEKEVKEQNRRKSKSSSTSSSTKKSSSSSAPKASVRRLRR